MNSSRKRFGGSFFVCFVLALLAFGAVLAGCGSVPAPVSGAAGEPAAPRERLIGEISWVSPDGLQAVVRMGIKGLSTRDRLIARNPSNGRITAYLMSTHFRGGGNLGANIQNGLPRIGDEVFGVD